MTDQFNPETLGPQRAVTNEYGTGENRTIVYRGDYRLASFKTKVHRDQAFSTGVPASVVIEDIEKVISENDILDPRLVMTRTGYEEEDSLMVRGWVLMTEDWRKARDGCIAREKERSEKFIKDQANRRYKTYLDLKAEFEGQPE